MHLVLDEEILQSELVAFHPLYNGMSIFLKPEEVVKFLNCVNRNYEVCEMKEKGYQKCLSN